MKLTQFHLPDKGTRLGLWEGAEVIDISCQDCQTVLDAVVKSAEKGAPLESVLECCPRGSSYAYESLDIPPDLNAPHLLVPITSPEVWGCGVTYRRSAETRDDDSAQDIYSRVYNSDRPEIFFKATPERSVGPNGNAGIRSDSDLTAIEPELAFVLAEGTRIVGFTICDDVSAWDIERENPLYLPQSKTFKGCCVLGPCIATSASIPDPYDLGISCSISRDGATIYEGEVNSSQIKFRFEQLAEILCRHNPVPVGTVVSTGTGIRVPNEFALNVGDQVEIEIEGIGRLAHGVENLGD